MLYKPMAVLKFSASRISLGGVMVKITTIEAKMEETEKKVNIPEPPESFNELEATYWYRYITSLDNEGFYNESFFSTVKSLCEWEAKRDEIKESMNNAPITNKHDQIHPSFTAWEKSEKMCISLRAKLGVTPVDVSKVKIKKKEDETDGFDDL